jgi:hypothetical protein
MGIATLADVWADRYTAKRNIRGTGWFILDTHTGQPVAFEEPATEGQAKRTAIRLNAQHSMARQVLARRT